MGCFKELHKILVFWVNKVRWLLSLIVGGITLGPKRDEVSGRSEKTKS